VPIRAFLSAMLQFIIYKYYNINSSSRARKSGKHKKAVFFSAFQAKKRVNFIFPGAKAGVL
jgi:hypothetical protein